MVRRSYNYERGPDDQGLIFSCFQGVLEKGFEAVQRRLQGEAMAKYTLTTGGGYFFVPPAGEAWLSALTESRHDQRLRPSLNVDLTRGPHHWDCKTFGVKMHR
ncbi:MULTISPECIES: hypothetical protein [Streptomyces]|uniref:Dyp-type peroxidase C-terminal domain-containing protein n=1 Tax=Streptomyces indiaensis TaxID=284033 RepID=A0ABP5QA34_9ACTN